MRKETKQGNSELPGFSVVFVCLSVCLSVCICLAPSWECVSEPSSLSVSVSPDPRPPTGAMAVALAAALAPAGCLTWRGCLRVSVCLSVCLHVARLLPPEGPVLGGRRGGKGGLGRAKGRGGRALGSPRWWLQVALGTGQVKSLQTINAGEGVEKREHSCTVGGNVNLYSHYGRQYGVSL